LGDGPSSKGELKSSVPKSRVVSGDSEPLSEPSFVLITCPPAVFLSRRGHLLLNHPTPFTLKAAQYRRNPITTRFKLQRRCNRGSLCSQIYKTVYPWFKRVSRFIVL